MWFQSEPIYRGTDFRSYRNQLTKWSLVLLFQTGLAFPFLASWHPACISPLCWRQQRRRQASLIPEGLFSHVTYHGSPADSSPRCTLFTLMVDRPRSGLHQDALPFVLPEHNNHRCFICQMRCQHGWSHDTGFLDHSGIQNAHQHCGVSSGREGVLHISPIVAGWDSPP